MHQNKKFRMKILALTLGVALLGTAAGVAIGTNLSPQSASAESLVALSSQAATSNDLDSPFKAVYNEVSQSIVGIQLNVQRNVANGRINSTSAFVGSGVVIQDGYVITNYHVVTGGGSEVISDISVIYNDEEFSAKYVGGDEENDIAVLQVKDLDAPAVKIGNSDALSVGDWALVIGNPLGTNYTNSLTVGVISGLNRTVSAGGSTYSTMMIQTDAAINSGNSGGGLFNIRGELIGITSSKLASSVWSSSAPIESIGFAIPINTVAEVADDLIEYGKVIHPRMGVSIRQIPSDSDEPTKDALPASVWVVEVEEGSPAERAGLLENDLILSADGERVRTPDELQAIIRSHSIGETVEIEVYRIPKLLTIRTDEDIPEGEYLTFEVELEALDEVTTTTPTAVQTEPEYRLKP